MVSATSRVELIGRLLSVRAVIWNEFEPYVCGLRPGDWIEIRTVANAPGAIEKVDGVADHALRCGSDVFESRMDPVRVSALRLTTYTLSDAELGLVATRLSASGGMRLMTVVGVGDGVGAGVGVCGVGSGVGIGDRNGVGREDA